MRKINIGDYAVGCQKSTTLEKSTANIINIFLYSSYSPTLFLPLPSCFSAFLLLSILLPSPLSPIYVTECSSDHNLDPGAFPATGLLFRAS